MSFFSRWFSGGATEKPTDGSNKLTSESVKVEGGKNEPVDEQRKSTLTQLLSNSLGMDITTGLSVPVYFCEPTTNLTRMAEFFEYAELREQVQFPFH